MSFLGLNVKLKILKLFRSCYFMQVSGLGLEDLICEKVNAKISYQLHMGRLDTQIKN